MIAALFVETNGVYFGLPDVEPWDKQRDAMQYKGPYSVIAHPPCARWCRLASFIESRYGYAVGDDGGMFEKALVAVRTFGGVLEHPAWSKAWYRYRLPLPSMSGGWQRGFCGGWSCHVEQGRYGHAVKKSTWLYAFGTGLPDLRWGYESDCMSQAHVWRISNRSRSLISRMNKGNPRAAYDLKPRLGKREAKRTTVEFRDELISLAKSVDVQKLQQQRQLSFIS